MVFEDRTDEADRDDTSETLMPERTVAQAVDLDALGPAEVTDAHPAPRLDLPETYDAADPPTIIDEALSEEVKAAIAAAGPPDEGAPDEGPLDERLANVALALEATDQELSPQAERTVKTASPFDVSVSPVVEIEPIGDAVEKTQRARVPFDLKIEHTLPPGAQKRKPGAKPPVIVERVGPGVVPKEPEPPKTPEPQAAAERTALDLAAALGMPPEPSATPAPEPSSSAPPTPQLRVPQKGAEPKLDLGLATAAAKSTSRLREGLRSDQLAGLTASTERIAKLIPIALGLLLVVATILVSLQLFRREERQEHVELRFMAIGTDRTVTAPSTAGTPIIIETDPPGLLVLFERKILGRTPYNGTVPVSLDQTVAAELSSPYFDRWLGEVRQGPAGDYTINVQLSRRDRRR